MKKTFCDICNKETDWNGTISMYVGPNISVLVRVHSTYSYGPGNIMNGVHADICQQCFLKALQERNGVSSNG